MIGRALFRRDIERRGASGLIPWGDSSIPTNGMLGSPAAGVAVNDALALSVATVYACVRILADSVSSLPVKVYSGTGPTRTEITNQPELISQPFAFLSRQDWFTQAMVSIVLRGNFYGRIIQRDQNLFATQIMPLHPDNVRVQQDRDTGAPTYLIRGAACPLEDMVHVRSGVQVPGSLMGVNPIEAARQTIGIAAAADRMAAALFANDASPGGIIQVPGTLSPDQALKLAQSWMQAHQGINKSHLPAVLTESATWQQITLSPDDAQFLQTRAFQKGEIEAWFGVPPHMLGDTDKTTSWGSGIDSQAQGFIDNTLLPYLLRFETAFSALLPRSLYVEFDISARLRGDIATRFASYAVGLQNGFLNRDGVRAGEGLPPIPNGEGQQFYMPANYVPVSGELLLPKPPASPTAPTSQGDQQNAA